MLYIQHFNKFEDPYNRSCLLSPSSSYDTAQLTIDATSHHRSDFWFGPLSCEILIEGRVAVSFAESLLDDTWFAQEGALVEFGFSSLLPEGWFRVGGSHNWNSNQPHWTFVNTQTQWNIHWHQGHCQHTDIMKHTLTSRIQSKLTKSYIFLKSNHSWTSFRVYFCLSTCYCQGFRKWQTGPCKAHTNDPINDWLVIWRILLTFVCVLSKKNYVCTGLMFYFASCF